MSSEVIEEDPVSCPNCPDRGWWVDYDRFSGEPEQVQCEFCYTVPNSVFNLKENK